MGGDEIEATVAGLRDRGVVFEEVDVPGLKTADGIAEWPSGLVATTIVSVISLGLIGVVESFWAVTGLIVVWALMVAAPIPIRQTCINGMIPSRQRATILSFDSLMSSAGGVWAQPALCRAAEGYGYAPSYLMSAGITVFALPCLLLSRRENAPPTPSR